MKKLVLVLGSVCAVALSVPSPAHADPDNPCPDHGGWFLTSPSPGDVVVDRNGDGLICVKAVNGRGSSRDVPGFTVMDDLFFVIEG